MDRPPVAVVQAHLRRWANTTDRRLAAAHPNRPAWNECRRGLFLEQLERDAPELTEPQRLAVLEAFESVVRRAVIFEPGKPPLCLPGRVSRLVEGLDAEGFRVRL